MHVGHRTPARLRTTGASASAHNAQASGAHLASKAAAASIAMRRGTTPAAATAARLLCAQTRRASVGCAGDGGCGGAAAGRRRRRRPVGKQANHGRRRGRALRPRRAEAEGSEAQGRRRRRGTAHSALQSPLAHAVVYAVAQCGLRCAARCVRAVHMPVASDDIYACNPFRCIAPSDARLCWRLRLRHSAALRRIRPPSRRPARRVLTEVLEGYS
jgi:hypothetical protein